MKIIRKKNHERFDKRRGLISRLAQSGLVLVLLLLTGFAVRTAAISHRLTLSTRATVISNELYHQARYDVGLEESLERKYRLDPSPEVRTEHHAAASALIAALTQIEKTGDQHDRTVVPPLLEEERQYMGTTDAMFDAVDARQPERVDYLDIHFADPVFGKLETVVDQEGRADHQEALDATAGLGAAQQLILVETPIVFAVGLTLLGIFLFVLRDQMASALRRTQTELSETEQQLLQSAKLASLGTLSAGVAHELNQPIAIIRGVAQQILDEPGLSTDLLADLELIEGQTGRMMKIVSHLRDFSRAGCQEADEVDVNRVITDCFTLVGAQLKVHNVAVDLRLGVGIPPILGDANELEQVFLNLIANARDAMEKRTGSLLTIRTRREQDRLVVEFGDNGPGICAEVMDRIFDPFFTTKAVGRGTGLGLSISHGIIEKHGGAIEARNDNGAVFTITLPVPSHGTDAQPAGVLQAA